MRRRTAPARSADLHVKLTPAESALLVDAATRRGVSISEIVRGAVARAVREDVAARTPNNEVTRADANPPGHMVGGDRRHDFAHE